MEPETVNKVLSSKKVLNKYEPCPGKYFTYVSF